MTGIFDSGRENIAMSGPKFWVPFEHVSIGGQRIITASRKELTEAMVQDCLGARDRTVGPRLVFDANGQGISMGGTHSGYRQAVDAADVIHADGGFLVSVSRFLPGSAIKERSATTDLMHDCAGVAAAHGLTFYLLGGDERVNANCVKRLQELYPGLQVVGRRDGFFTEEQEAGIIDDINRVNPDVLWIGLGKPKEQIFSVKWRGSLNCGWLITCGGCYNYITGDYPRAPLWMQNFNLEWIYRAFTSRKLFWRYFITTPHALWIIATRLGGGKA